MWSLVKKSLGKKDKRGVSVLIGYVLLIVIAVIIAAIVYTWLRTYVPTESLNCPDGSSIYISDANYCDNLLSLTLKNNGRFDLAGYFIHASNSSGQIATIDLSQDFNSTLSYGNSVIFGNSILFSTQSNSFSPGEQIQHIFNVPHGLVSVQIIPTRFQEQNNRNVFASCSDAQVVAVDLSCKGAIEGCVPDDISTTCGTAVCGQKTNNCGQLVTCPPNNCDPSTELCSNGQCVSKFGCQDTCSTLGYECGNWTICGIDNVPCGPNNGQCDYGFQCNSGQCNQILNDGVCAPGENCLDPDCQGLQARCPSGQLCNAGVCSLTSDCSAQCIGSGYSWGSCLASNQCRSPDSAPFSGNAYCGAGNGVCCCTP